MAQLVKRIYNVWYVERFNCDINGRANLGVTLPVTFQEPVDRSILKARLDSSYHFQVLIEGELLVIFAKTAGLEWLSAIASTLFLQSFYLSLGHLSRVLRLILSGFPGHPSTFFI
jgi:hypothetical protein